MALRARRSGSLSWPSGCWRAARTGPTATRSSSRSPTPPPTSIRASALTRRRRRRTSCSSARSSGSTPNLQGRAGAGRVARAARSDLTYVARLRHGVRFHDGRELTADGCRVYVPRAFSIRRSRGRKGAYRDVLRVGDALDPLHRRLHAQAAVRLVPDQPGDGDRAGGPAHANARTPIGTGPYQAGGVHARRSPRPDAVRRLLRGAPKNAGIVLKVVPDDTMRGLELRKGAVDLVVNDLAPDIVWQLQREGRLRDRHRARHRLRLHRAEPARSGPADAPGAAGDRLSRSTARRSSSTCAAASRTRRSASCRRCRGRSSREVFDFRHDPAEAKRLLDEAGYPRSRRRRAAAAAAADAQDVDRRGLSAAGRRDPAGPRARRHRARDAVERVRDAVRRHRPRQLPAVHRCSSSASPIPDMLRRVFHSSQVPPAGFNRAHYQNAEVDRLIDAAAASRSTRSARRCTARAQRIIAARRAVSSACGTSTNVAVFQPDIQRRPRCRRSRISRS